LARIPAVADNVGVRLFVAVWPPDDVIDLINGLSRPEIPGLKWTVRQQWHVTLRFLGEVQKVDEVSEALRELSGTGASEAVLGPATAWFPGRRVLQIPVSGLEDLSLRANRAIAQVDGAPASAESAEGPGNGFRGHLTLARVRGKTRIDAAHARKLEGEQIRAEWIAHKVSLVASSLRSDGARYSDVEVVELG
jgi:2'-5' RNA ligase